MGRKMERTSESSDSSLGLPPLKSMKLCSSSSSSSLTATEKEAIDNLDSNENSGNETSSSPATSSALHPLLDIDLVLQKVFSYLDTSYLKAVNLVCKTWSTAVRKLMIKKMVLDFTEKTAREFLQESQDDSLCFFLRHDIIGSPVRLRLAWGKGRGSNGIWCDFETENMKYVTALALVEKLVQMNAVIVDLKLEFCPEHGTPAAWKIISRLHEQLERLDIDTQCRHCRYIEGINSEHFPPFLESHELADEENLPSGNFLEENISFPNLKILSGKYKEGAVPPLDKVGKLFRKLLLCSPGVEGLHCQFLPSEINHEMFNVVAEKPDALQQLKSLSHVHLNQDELQILSSKNLKLRSLSMSLHSGFRYPALNPFLSSQGGTLESLTIDFLTLPRNLPEKFPCGVDLVNLKHLQMKSFRGPIHFVSHMSNLESLILEDVNLSLALQQNEYQYKSKLKSLQIFDSRGATGRFLLPTIYNDIVSFFPELKHLRMEYFTDSTLKIIVEGLPHLEELDIPNGIYSDRILIERSLPDREASNDNGNDPDYPSQSKEACSVDRATCLADLKKLRKVVLQSPKITDGGIRYGLLYCRELRHIYIDSRMISDIGLKLLCENQDIQHLEFVNCYQLTSAGIEEAKQLWGRGRTLFVANK